MRRQGGVRPTSIESLTRPRSANLTIDTSTALRGTGALIGLVQAVVNADQHDESDAIEWKSTLDASTRDGCFHVPRAVLGLANREPGRSKLIFEGYGYVVVGAEPGRLAGAPRSEDLTERGSRRRSRTRGEGLPSSSKDAAVSVSDRRARATRR
jgi:hypothetical protein